MTIALDRLAQSLESALGEDVNSDPAVLSAHTINASRPALVCSPAATDQVATILRICAEAKAAVTPWGGGTGINVGNAPRETCVIIDLTRLNRIIEHDHANLTVTAECGITLAALHESLSVQQQFLPFDAPQPAKATIGGTVALNLNGPRRGYYGGTRDLVTGMKVALATGEQIKAGGKVVKNVAGYDMCKLFTGSLGTLGIITQLTLRVAPVPESMAALVASGGLNATMELVDGLSKSQLVPAAITVLHRPRPQITEKTWQVAVWCEGLPETVARQLSDGELMARRVGLGTEILRGGSHGNLWNEIRDFPLRGERCVYRVIVPRATAGYLIEELETRASEPTAAFLADMVTGTIWLSWPASSQAAAAWPQLLSLATEHHGHAVMFAAPDSLKEGRDVWGAPPAALSLMQGIKRQFDPDALLNPGRLIGGL